MSHWIVAPIILPAFTAAFLVMALRHDLARQRIVSFGATALLLAVAVGLFALAGDGAVRPYLLGNWPAPFGIVLVLDRLSALMLLLTAFLALAVLVYACEGWDAKGRHFHPLFQFQLMGLCGAFLTGDAFNLFVFFEVMLIASYGLMLHGGGAPRLKAGFQYVAINLVGSTLFLFAVGLIYATTGTLNMADIALKAPQVAAGDVALLRTGALLLLLVFALKAALVPLHWWLPTTYAAAPAPVAALFAIMTKVGAYSIIRIHAMVFGPEAGELANAAEPWIVPAALLTLAVGAIGVVATRRLLDLVAFAAVWSMGSLLVAVGLFGPRGLTAALYYTVHSTIATAGLFLLADMVMRHRGQLADRLSSAAPVAQAALVSGLFFLAAIAMAGLPPLSGFIGKLLILDAAREAPSAAWVWSLVLATSLVVIIGFSRAGSVLFWKTEAAGAGPLPAGSAAPGPAAAGAPRWPASAVLAVAVLIGGTGALTLFAGPATATFEATAAQVLDVRGYVAAVLGPEAAAQLGGAPGVALGR
ncbi:monovalent cation/H+ antiporter subunit D [Arenibaculum sp.]|uniref:monovalent cation/H+ antiporter subunit D n=1 Tax=Arenibaculum sp. TaxID=2865862 RepID=UPI002E0D37CE|nr:monovalent cation/H+ antiporter subunit D [Arenibaculum sp.]